MACAYMLGLLLVLLRVLLTNPVAASHAAAWATAQPELAQELVKICRRESRCMLVSVHEKDAHAGPLMHYKALKVGWLDRECTWHHGQSRRFSTRGAHGLSAAYSLRFLGACLPPEVLDIPIFSALAAARRARYMCERYDACTRNARYRFWIGARKYDRAKARAAERRRARAQPLEVQNATPREMPSSQEEDSSVQTMSVPTTLP